MKKISLLCQKLLLLGVLISVSSTVFGQNTIYSIPGVTSKASIVREYQSGIYIVYNTDGSGGHDFLYVDINVPVVYKVSSPINLPMVQINDFEIWEDELYFCGTDGTSGLVGRFNIPSMFNGTYSLDFFSLQPLWNCDAQLTTMVTNLLRLELLPVNNGIHILAIGEGSGGTSRQVVDIGVDYSDPTNYEYIMVDMWGGYSFMMI